jgi:signal transduction histidine kinase/ActR/RegA family two-component response regulator
MGHDLINPADSLERQNEKLLRIADTLMRRAEQNTDSNGVAYVQFERAVMLEDEVRTRTRELERALDLLNDSNARLAQANAETEAARADLANAIETVQEGFALFNARDELVMCNSRFGKHMRDVHHLFKPGLPFAEYVRLISESPFMALPEGQRPDDWAADRMAHHKDRHVVFNARMAGRRWLQVSEHRTPDGGTVVLQTDVTDMVRMERRERERLIDDQAKLIRATLEHLNQGVCIFDSDNQLAGWNRHVAELLSVPMGRFYIGASFDTLFAALQMVVEFADSGTPEQIRSWIYDHQRAAPLKFEITRTVNRTIAVFAQTMPDNGFVISFTDVSAERAAVRAMSQVNEMLERRVTERTLELEDALSEAERANASKSRFVAAASHDLLQPLSAAKLFVGSLQSDLEQPEMRDRLGKAQNALQSVEHILEALLDISRLDSGRAEVNLGSVALGDVIGQLCEELSPVAAQSGVEMRAVPTSAHVRSDVTYLRRVAQNLISNAIRYSDHGKVLVGVRHLPRSVRLEVWDNGPGIPENQQERVFDEFHRLHASANPSDGMGLGLAIVERACRLLEHPLHLHSVEGRGTRFSVELPRALGKAPNGPAAHTPDATLPQQIVLLIEDDAELRNALTLTLESWGQDVFACGDLKQAQDLLTDVDIAPDCMIVDFQLGNGQLGSDAVVALRARHGAIPACVITANRSGHLREICARIGADLLHKPLDPKALRGFLSEAAQNRLSPEPR